MPRRCSRSNRGAATLRRARRRCPCTGAATRSPGCTGLCCPSGKAAATGTAVSTKGGRSSPPRAWTASSSSIRSRAYCAAKRACDSATSSPSPCRAGSSCRSCPGPDSYRWAAPSPTTSMGRTISARGRSAATCAGWSCCARAASARSALRPRTRSCSPPPSRDWGSLAWSPGRSCSSGRSRDPSSRPRPSPFAGWTSSSLSTRTPRSDSSTRWPGSTRGRAASAGCISVATTPSARARRPLCAIPLRSRSTCPTSR